VELSSFEKLNDLTSGGFGGLYRAPDRRPEKEVAVKLLKGRLTEGTAVMCFRREVDVLASLDHNALLGLRPSEWGFSSDCDRLHGRRFASGNLEPNVADFGLSTFVDPDEVANQAMFGGTAEHCAPEILDAKPYDFSVNVVASGVLTWATISWRARTKP
jgi:serine/threonine protein kinase